LVLIVGVSACLWGGRFLYLAALGDEGALPPASRAPRIPAGATLVAADKACGSGGCWREITVRPAAGQTAEELARQMGLTGEQQKSPTLTDPATVHVSSWTRDGLLVIDVGYQ
jgi:hypothetical protein